MVRVDSLVWIEKLDADEGSLHAIIDYGMAALHWAARNRHQEIVMHLLGSGATVDAMAMANGIVMQIGELDVNKRSVNMCAEGGMTALHWAARNGHKDIVKCLMEIRGNHREGTEVNGILAQTGELDMNGGSVNISAKGKMTAL
jgi:ankyrin repeat protein